MKDFHDLESRIPSIGSGQMSLQDIKKISVENASENEAISHAIKAITMLATRVMTVDACIDIMRKREPFSGLDRVFERMQMYVQALSDDCLKVYEFCVADNVLACMESDIDDQNEDDIFDDPLPNQVNLAADPEEVYGHKGN